MSTPSEKQNLIINCLSSGMDFDDACILAHCSIEQIKEFRANEFFMSQCNYAAKDLERDLLSGLMTTIAIQRDKGKDHGTIWLLGKLNPRFSDRPEAGDKPGTINIFTEKVELAEMSTVEIHDNPLEEEDTASPLLNTNPLHDGEKY